MHIITTQSHITHNSGRHTMASRYYADLEITEHKDKRLAEKDVKLIRRALKSAGIKGIKVFVRELIC